MKSVQKGKKKVGPGRQGITPGPSPPRKIGKVSPQLLHIQKTFGKSKKPPKKEKTPSPELEQDSSPVLEDDFKSESERVIQLPPVSEDTSKKTSSVIIPPKLGGILDQNELVISELKAQPHDLELIGPVFAPSEHVSPVHSEHPDPVSPVHSVSASPVHSEHSEHPVPTSPVHSPDTRRILARRMGVISLPVVIQSLGNYKLFFYTILIMTMITLLSFFIYYIIKRVRNNKIK